MALGTARTCSSLSSSGVIILIRLGRLPEGESRVPPPLEAARASIVLLSFGTRAGRMRTRRVGFRVFGKRQRARPGRRAPRIARIARPPPWAPTRASVGVGTPTSRPHRACAETRSPRRKARGGRRKPWPSDRRGGTPRRSERDVLVTVVRADLRSALSESIENNDVPVVRSPAVFKPQFVCSSDSKTRR